MDPNFSMRELTEIGNRSLVFVTSAHLLYDRRNFFYYLTERNIVSALHIISTLKPIASVYYPHDYKDPIKDEEINYLSLFDLLLWPYVEKDARLDGIITTQTVGWIKYIRNRDVLLPPMQENGGRVFFLGAYQTYLNAGMETFYDDFAELFAAGLSVKLPRWHDNEQFEQMLVNRGVAVYPSDTNSIDVMCANEVIVTHALSSVVLEGCQLGKSVIYIQNPRFDYLDPQESFRDAGNVVFVDSPSAAVQAIKSPLPRNRTTMLPFDFEAARTAIWNEWKRKAAA